MFGFGKKAENKKNLEDLKNQYATAEARIKKAEKAISEDASLYKWQKQRKLKKLRHVEANLIVDYVEKKKKLENTK